jgi:hypothetical protein
MSEAKTNNINYFTFLHGYDIVNAEDVFHKVYNFSGYGVEVYSINSGYYGYYQKKSMIEWLVNTMSKDDKSIKIAYYHNPVFPGHLVHKATFEEIDARQKLRQIFTKYNVKFAFEHHENLYKVSYPLRDKTVVTEGQSTTYLGGGNWGTPPSQYEFTEKDKPYYISKLAKENHVWLMSIQALDHIIGSPKIQTKITSIKLNGDVIDSI